MLTEPTDEIKERIADAFCNNGGDGVNILDTHQHNACNHTVSGVIAVDGEWHGFQAQMGDWRGFDMLAWGDPEDVGVYRHVETGEQLTFIPANLLLRTSCPAKWREYLKWRKQPWFQEKERSYLYDRHFQPGVFVEGYYRKWAAAKGMTIGLLSAVVGHKD